MAYQLLDFAQAFGWKSAADVTIACKPFQEWHFYVFVNYVRIAC